MFQVQQDGSYIIKLLTKYDNITSVNLTITTNRWIILQFRHAANPTKTNFHEMATWPVYANL